MTDEPTSPLPFRDSTEDEIIAYQEARERFFDVVYEWANGLIEGGIRTRRNGTSESLAALESLTVPKVAYTRSEYPGNMEITISDLPEEQQRVWRAAHQLIVDAYKATREPSLEPERVSVSLFAPMQVDRLTFTRDHGSCPTNVNYENHRVDCLTHNVFALYIYHPEGNSKAFDFNPTA